MHAIKTLLLSAAVAGVLAPTQARADGYITPWVGVGFGNSPSTGRGAFGASAGYMGAGVIGGEADFGVSPSFFGTRNDFGHNTVLTGMGNLIVGVPIGGTFGRGARPYVTAGLGLLRTQIDGGNLVRASSSNNDLGWNAGGGVMGYFSQHVGMRGDLRYFGDTNDHGSSSTLHFWRASVGVVFR